jgi:hypothetical protein
MNSHRFDDLVGTREQRERHVEAECPGGLQVDHQLVLNRRLHRQVGGLFSFEDAVDVAGGFPEHISQIDAIRNQAPIFCLPFIRIDRRQAVLGRKRNDSFVMVTGKGVSTYHETAIGFACKCCYRLLKIALVTDGSGNHFDHKRCARCLGIAEVLPT